MTTATVRGNPVYTDVCSKQKCHSTTSSQVRDSDKASNLSLSRPGLFFFYNLFNNYHQSVTHIPLRIIFPLIKESRVVCFLHFTPLTRTSPISILPPTLHPVWLEEGSPLAVPPLAVSFQLHSVLWLSLDPLQKAICPL